MRTFEYSDGKSSKFWNIELQGKSFTVTFGRIGSKGQTPMGTPHSCFGGQAVAVGPLP